MMRTSLASTALLVAAAAASLLTCQASAQRGEPATEIERAPNGKPKLDGIWQALVPANWNIEPHSAAPGPISDLGARGAVPPGLGVVDGGELPYLESARDQLQRNRSEQLERDPEVKCFMPGVPRAAYIPYPFQIFQTDEYVMIAYQFANAMRTIHMNDPGPAPTSFWMGWSVGRWEGDSLVVDVTRQKADTWFDRAGNFHSDELHVVERYTPLGPNHLQYEATIEDPKVFSRPSAEFDPDEPIMLRGVVTMVEFINPHSWIHIEVTNETGRARPGRSRAVRLTRCSEWASMTARCRLEPRWWSTVIARGTARIARAVGTSPFRTVASSFSAALRRRPSRSHAESG